MSKLNVCILFGGISPEHEVSLRSAESVLNNIDQEKYHVYPVGITKEGQWIRFGGTDYTMLPGSKWLEHPDNRPCALSPVRGQGLLVFESDCTTQEMIDVTAEYSREMGLVPYYLYRQKNMAGNFENVGYAVPGKECIYNILIMEEKQTIVACGAGTTTKVVFPKENRLERVENVKDVALYIERIDEMIERKEKMLEKLG